VATHRVGSGHVSACSSNAYLRCPFCYLCSAAPGVTGQLEAGQAAGLVPTVVCCVAASAAAPENVHKLYQPDLAQSCMLALHTRLAACLLLCTAPGVPGQAGGRPGSWTQGPPHAPHPKL
jgi:hypothetical protein